MKKVGVLSPLSLLPGHFGIGDLGGQSYRFIKQISKMGMRLWQILPLGPMGFSDSPYQSYSSYAGDPVYIDPETLFKKGYLAKKPHRFLAGTTRVEYEKVRAYKERIFRKAFSGFRKKGGDLSEVRRNEKLLEHAVYQVLKKKNGGKPWTEFPESDFRISQTRDFSSLDRDEIDYELFLQKEFFEEYRELKKFANRKGIEIIGDLPFYPGMDSADVFFHQRDFLLSADHSPLYTAGVAPDYFSPDGQHWGNPIYDFEKMKEGGYAFLCDRILAQFALYDYLRLDHFRAFDTYYRIPAGTRDAKCGEWVNGPGSDFFDVLFGKDPELKIIAEDLGLLRPEVYVLRDRYRFPGMNVLQFTLTDPGFSVTENMVTYTGTHDNDVIFSWYENMTETDRLRVTEILTGEKTALKPERIPKAAIRYAIRHTSDTVILPLQDILGLKEGRTNLPGIVSPDNWTYHLPSLRGLCREYDFIRYEIFRGCNDI